MKMYFVVREGVPSGLSIVGVAHGAMMAEIKWGEGDYKLYQEWKDKSFKKVVVKATEEQFQHVITNVSGFFVTESSLNNQSTVFVCYPGDKDSMLWDYLNKLPLFKGGE